MVCLNPLKDKCDGFGSFLKMKLYWFIQEGGGNYSKIANGHNVLVYLLTCPKKQTMHKELGLALNVLKPCINFF